MDKRVRVGWQFWAHWQGSERATGWSLTFIRHDPGTFGFWCIFEVLFLFTVQFGWNWY